MFFPLSQKEGVVFDCGASHRIDTITTLWIRTPHKGRIVIIPILQNNLNEPSPLRPPYERNRTAGEGEVERGPFRGLLDRSELRLMCRSGNYESCRESESLELSFRYVALRTCKRRRFR